jgi:hypothetical protein
VVFFLERSILFPAGSSPLINFNTLKSFILLLTEVVVVAAAAAAVVVVYLFNNISQ